MIIIKENYFLEYLKVKMDYLKLKVQLHKDTAFSMYSDKERLF